VSPAALPEGAHVVLVLTGTRADGQRIAIERRLDAAARPGPAAAPVDSTPAETTTVEAPPADATPTAPAPADATPTEPAPADATPAGPAPAAETPAK
jgi:hypothetical protein